MPTIEQLQSKLDSLQVYLTAANKANILRCTVLDKSSNISNTYEYIEEALKKYNLWDIVNEPDKTKYAHSSIPGLIKHGKKNNEFVVEFINNIFNPINDKDDDSINYNVFTVMSKILNYYIDYTNIVPSIHLSSDMENKLSKKDFSLLFNNLILNTINCNESKNKLTVYINAIQINGKTEFTYYDNGKGLPDKYKANPYNILNLDESNIKEDKSMWIVNNIIEKYNGTILNIESDNGFKIIFRI